MKKIFVVFVLGFLLFSCGNDKDKIQPEGTQNNIKGQNISSGGENNVQNINEDLSSNFDENLNNFENVLDLQENDIEEGGKLAENLDLKYSEYCLLDECIPNDVEITDDENYYYGNYSNLGQFSYKLAKDGSYFEKQEDSEIIVVKRGDIFVKNINNENYLEQKVYNESGEEQKDYILDDLAREVYIGDFTFSQTLSWMGSFSQTDFLKNEGKIYLDEEENYKVYEDETEFITYITTKSLNEDKKLYKSYIAQFEGYSGIKFIYTSKNYSGDSFRIGYLGTDEEYLSENIKENGNYMDLDITNKIIGYYGKNSGTNYVIMDNDGNSIYEVSQEDLPFFRVEKIRDNGNYLIYFSNPEKYSLQTLAK